MSFTNSCSSFFFHFGYFKSFGYIWTIFKMSARFFGNTFFIVSFRLGLEPLGKRECYKATNIQKASIALIAIFVCILFSFRTWHYCLNIFIYLKGLFHNLKCNFRTKKEPPRTQCKHFYFYSAILSCTFCCMLQV